MLQGIPFLLVLLRSVCMCIQTKIENFSRALLQRGLFCNLILYTRLCGRVVASKLTSYLLFLIFLVTTVLSAVMPCFNRNYSIDNKSKKLSYPTHLSSTS